MRKVKIETTAKIPSWNFCNSDKATGKLSVSKELCRFCHSSKTGYRCSLYNCGLSDDRGLVNKAPQCIHATTWGTATVLEEDIADEIKVDPKLLVKETLKSYKKTVNELLNQGYPPNLAETVAEQYVLGEGK